VQLALLLKKDQWHFLKRDPCLLWNVFVPVIGVGNLNITCKEIIFIFCFVPFCGSHFFVRIVNPLMFISLVRLYFPSSFPSLLSLCSRPFFYCDTSLSFLTRYGSTPLSQLCGPGDQIGRIIAYIGMGAVVDFRQFF
jgi:hypothetical protein